MDNGENLPDPYSIKQDKWTDDVKPWPYKEYGDIYNCLAANFCVYICLAESS